jgi:bifunctional DNase/RNase
MIMDSRPSDAIALALRCGAPMLVAEPVMNEAGQVIQAPNGEAKEQGAAETGNEQHPRPKLTPVEHLKRALDKAVKEEKYEEAARLRDEIKRLEHPHTGN